MRENMVTLRRQLNMTQEKAAMKIGIARTTYTNIETGKRDPSLEVALRIKRVFCTTEDCIFDRAHTA